jgi:hypothetical protein
MDMSLKKPLMLLTVVLMLTAMSGDVLADISNAAVLFLRIPTTARSAGMGNAFVAIADDASANHFNPAGLGAYPLSDAWIEAELPYQYRPIQQIAALKIGSGSNHLDWEVWALANNKLVRYDNRSWETGESFGTGADETLAQIVARHFAVVEDEYLAHVTSRVAEANSRHSFEWLTALADSIRAVIPADYKGVTDIQTGLDSVLALYELCLINWDRIAKVQEHVRRGLRDGELGESDCDRINFAIERSINRYLPEEIIIPYSAVIEGNPTSLASVSKGILIGSESGLYYFDGNRWQVFNATNGLPSRNVFSLKRTGSTVLVGTDKGIITYNGLVFDSLTATEPLPEGPVTAMGSAGTNKIYAIVDNRIYFYNGATWSDSYEYSVTIDESIQTIARRLSVYQTERDKAACLELLYELNPQLSNGSGELDVGTVLQAPFSTPLRGEVNDIWVGPLQRVWLGTDHGVIEFDGTQWELLGYQEHTVAEGETMDVLVDLKRHRTAADRDTYVQTIRMINDLPQGDPEVGSSIRVYRDPRASAIYSIERWEVTTYFASSAGLLQTDGTSWSRADVESLGNREARGVYSDGTQVWFATADKLVLKARAQREVDLMHVKWLPGLADDLHYGYAATTIPIEGWGTLGFAFPLLHYGTFARTNNSPDVVGEFTSFDFAASASFGTSLTRKLKGGITAKVIYSRLTDQGAGEEVGEGTATGFAVDLGLLYEASRRLNLAAVVTNLGPEMAYIDASQSDPLPRNLALGFAYKLLHSDYYRLTVTAEANKLLVGLDDPGFLKNELLEQSIFNFGAEFQYTRLLAARAGYVFDEEGEVKTPTFGFGLSPLSWAWVDFAYIPNNDDLPLANTLYTSIRFML